MSKVKSELSAVPTIVEILLSEGYLEKDSRKRIHAALKSEIFNGWNFYQIAVVINARVPGEVYEMAEYDHAILRITAAVNDIAQLKDGAVLDFTNVPPYNNAKNCAKENPSMIDALTAIADIAQLLVIYRASTYFPRADWIIASASKLAAAITSEEYDLLRLDATDIINDLRCAVKDGAEANAEHLDFVEGYVTQRLVT